MVPPEALIDWYRRGQRLVVEPGDGTTFEGTISNLHFDDDGHLVGVTIDNRLDAVGGASASLMMSIPEIKSIRPVGPGSS